MRTWAGIALAPLSALTASLAISMPLSRSSCPDIARLWMWLWKVLAFGPRPSGRACLHSELLVS